MSEPFDPFALDSEPFDPFAESVLAPKPNTEPPKRSLIGTLGDIGTAAAKTVVGTGEAAVGVLNIPTFGHFGKALQDGIGYDPKRTQAELSSGYSDAQQAAQARAAEGKGFIGSIQSHVANPSTILTGIGESVGPMLLGGAVGKGVGLATKAPAWVLGGIGEGVVGAGSAAEQIRQGAEDGTLSGKQVLSALGSGVGTGALGVLGGKIANSKIGKSLGLGDIDTAMVSGTRELAEGATKRNILSRVLGGAVSEGVLEELPQSVQEQMWQNFATDRPIMEGVPESAGVGLLLGAAMGGGFNAATRQPPAPTPKPTDAELDQGNAALTATGDQYEGAVSSTPLLGYTPEPIVAGPPGSLADAAGTAQMSGAAEAVRPLGQNAPLKAYQTTEAAQDYIAQQKDPELYTVIRHPRAKAGFAVVPKQQADIDGIMAGRRTQEQTDVRTQQLAQEEEEGARAKQIRKTVLEMQSEAKALERSVTKDTPVAEANAIRQQATELRQQAIEMYRQVSQGRIAQQAAAPEAQAANTQAALADNEQTELNRYGLRSATAAPSVATPGGKETNNVVSGSTTDLGDSSSGVTGIGATALPGMPANTTQQAGATELPGSTGVGNTAIQGNTTAIAPATTRVSEPSTAIAGNALPANTAIEPAMPLQEAGTNAPVTQEQTAQQPGEAQVKQSRRRQGEAQDAYLYRVAAEKNQRKAEVAKANQPTHDKRTLPTRDTDTNGVRRVLKDTTAEIVRAEEMVNESESKDEISRQQAQFIAQVARLFKKRVVFFKSAKGTDGYYQGDDNTVYLNTRSTVAHLRVLGHELTHAMKQQVGDAYSKMLSAVSNLLTDKELSAHFKDYFGPALTDMVALDQPMSELTDLVGEEFAKGNETLREFLTEEWMADLAGNRFGEAAFWDELFQEIESQHGNSVAKNIINRLRMAFNNALNKILQVLKGGEFTVDQRLQDHLLQIRAAVKEGFVVYEKAVKAGQLQEGTGVKFGAKMATAKGNGVKAENEAARVLFEVAPDPNNAALTSEWNSLADNDKLKISETVASKIIPELLTQFGINGHMSVQIGGYKGQSNPSFTILLDGDASKLLNVAKSSGFILSQDMMIAVSDKPFDGGQRTGAVTIYLPEGATASSVYDKIYSGVKEAEGHTTVDGQMIILSNPEFGISTEELGLRIEKALGKEYDLRWNDDVYAAFPEKKDYGYDSTLRKNAPGSSNQAWAYRLRDEANQLLSAELEKHRTKRSTARPNAASAERAGGSNAQAGGVLEQYGKASPSAVRIQGFHYSGAQRQELDGRYFGTAYAGRESARVNAAKDARIKERICFYVDAGKGVTPESGVGPHLHTVNLNNVYDANKDTFVQATVPKQATDDEWLNAFESAVIDAGFDGYVSDFANQRAAVLLGRHSVPVTYLGTGTPQAAAPAAKADTTRKYAMLSKEIRHFETFKHAIAKAAPSAKVDDSGTMTYDAKDAEGVRKFFPAAKRSTVRTFGDTKVIENPMRYQAENLLAKSQDKVLRGVRSDDGTLYLWDAYDAHHNTIIKHLGEEDSNDRLIIENLDEMPEGVFSGEPGYRSVIVNNAGSTSVSEGSMAEFEAAMAAARMKVGNKLRFSLQRDNTLTDGLRNQPQGNRTLDAAELRELRRAASRLERPERGLFLFVSPDGRLLATGHKGKHISPAFAKFAKDHDLTLEAYRAVPGRTTAMPAAYREDGASYFEERDAQRTPIERTGLTRFSAARAGWKQDDMFESDFATKRTTIKRDVVVSSKGDKDVIRLGNVNSSGNQIALTKQGLENFWNWYGDGPTDNNGRPTVLHHATNSDITQFEIGRKTTNNYGFLGDVETSRAGIFATPDAAFAQEYLREGNGGNVMPVYMALENPIDLRRGFSERDEAALEAAGVNTRFIHNAPTWWELFDNADDGTNYFVEALKKAGYDGAIINEDSPTRISKGGETYIAFEPTQIKSATGNTGEFDGKNPDIRRSNARSGSPFYSQLAKSFETAKFQVMNGTGWLQWLKANAPKLGIKQDEMQWTGINEWLEMQGRAKVSREDVLAYLQGNGVRVQEVVKGSGTLKPEGDFWKWQEKTAGYTRDEWARLDPADQYAIYADYEQKFPQTKFSQYVVPGGENYRELLLTLPKKMPEEIWTVFDTGVGKWKVQKNGDVHNAKEFTSHESAQELADSNNRIEHKKNDTSFQSSHWDEPNVLAHIRFDERTDADGNKVLFVQELQSDFGQSYKKQRDAISKAVDDDFLGIAERMKQAGVLEINCD